MTPHSQSTVVIIGVALAAPLMLWWIRNVRSFAADYGFDGAFGGQRYETLIHTSSAEDQVMCFIGADRDYLFVLRHPKMQRRWWGYRRPVYQQNVRIPWGDIETRPGNLLRHAIMFYVVQRKMAFFVPRDVAMQVLADAGRTLPAGV